MTVLQIKGQHAVLEVSLVDLVIINNAISEAIHLLSIGDFHPRIGGSVEEAKTLRDNIGRVIDQMPQTDG